MAYDKSTTRLAVFSWAFYDFANSAFTTLVVTFIYATYFTQGIAPNEIVGTALWSQGVTITALVVAFSSPFLGAMADQGGHKKRYLLITTALTVFGSIVLYFAEPGQVYQALIWFIFANIAFEMSNVFYNAFLPDIAPLQKIGRISGYGWALGYVGGLAALVVALVGFVQTETPWFGFSKELGENIRATNLLVAAWFAIFSIPMFLWVKERKRPKPESLRKQFFASVQQLGRTFHEVRRYRQIVRLLLARLLYNDGLITIFAFGGIYAAGTFNFAMDEIIIFGIVLNVAAGLGAFAMGFLDDKVGGKNTVQLSNLGLVTATLIAVLAPSKTVFWIAGILVGIFAGPNQASSRSLMGRFVPAEKETEFFGFFAFSGKATAFLGPFLFGYFTELFNTQRAGVLTVLFFFVAGMLLLTIVNEKEGIESAKS